MIKFENGKHLTNYILKILKNTNTELTNKEEMYKYTLKVGSEKEVINEMIWTIGNEPTLEEAKEYFENHKERR